MTNVTHYYTLEDHTVQFQDNDSESLMLKKKKKSLPSRCISAAAHCSTFKLFCFNNQCIHRHQSNAFSHTCKPKHTRKNKNKTKLMSHCVLVISLYMYIHDILYMHVLFFLVHIVLADIYSFKI